MALHECASVNAVAIGYSSSLMLDVAVVDWLAVLLLLACDAFLVLEDLGFLPPLPFFGMSCIRMVFIMVLVTSA